MQILKYIIYHFLAFIETHLSLQNRTRLFFFFFFFPFSEKSFKNNSKGRVKLTTSNKLKPKFGLIFF